MGRQSGLSESSVISQMAVVEGCPLRGVPLYIYHTSKTHANVSESMAALQLHVVYKSCIFLQTSHARIHISTTCHVKIRIRYCKWRALRLNVQWFIIITIVPSYTGKNITRLLTLALLLVLCTRNNTDGNKLVIFSGIASYYGDNYIMLILYTNCIL